MSDKSNKLVSPHEPKNTVTVEGHGGTSFEGTDASAGTVIWSLSIIAICLVVVFAISVFFQRIFADKNPPGEPASPLAPARVVPPAPQLQVHPWEELPDLRAHENQVLSSSFTDKDGHRHIPIDSAIPAVVSRLNIKPNAPQGLTTPGGEGLEFSHSLSSMPPAYQGPQIQGEIEKHGQK